MKCSRVEELAKLYELGELDYFQKKAFEKHIKECTHCKKKYKNIVLLAALLFSSPKTVKKNYLKETLILYVLKLITLTFVAGVITFGGYIVLNDLDNVKDKKNNKTKIVETKQNTEEKEIIETKIIDNKNEEKHTNKNTIKIKAVDGNKSLNIEIDNETMKVNKRIENEEEK